MAEPVRAENSVIIEQQAADADTSQIYRILTQMANDIHGMSQAAVRAGSVPDTSNSFSGAASERSGDRWKANSNMNRQNTYDGSTVFEQFTNGFKKAFDDSLFKDLRNNLNEQLNGLADSLGVDLKNLSGEIGNRFAKQALSGFKSTDMGQKFEQVKGKLSEKLTNMSQNAVDKIGKLANGENVDLGKFGKFAGKAGNAATTISDTVAGGMGKAGSVLNKVGGGLAEKGGLLGKLGQGAAKAGGAAQAAGTGLASSGASAAVGGMAKVGAMMPQIAVAVLAIAVAIKVLKKMFAPLIEGVGAFIKALSGAANSAENDRKKFEELSKERIKQDIESMVTAPFEILKDAANKVYAAWDNVAGKIASTQGYTKADVQDLMASYSQRLRKEGLSRVVSAADISTNLEKVLDSGLSGKVAEEFSYIATKLNAAIPTEDFFSYAGTYASIAANALQQGYSQSEAIAYANTQLEDFASNVLYASRQIAEGFSTGLKDASSILESSVKIANAAKTNNSTEISGVLTSISAAVGAVAPDLASGLVNNVVDAAIGGNSESITALRSLSGVGASNTAFLNALAKDPQKVFSNLFENLSDLQTMSASNFMEVAEGLSQIFGVSMDALARVDFSYLAKAVSAMNTNNASLEENMKLLASGETTSTAEQDRIAEINKYILEEGLAYVLDNEVARSIQEHMWDEQIARELQQTTYAVEIKGALVTLIEGIAKTVKNIINFLNPFSWLKKLGNVISESRKASGLSADIRSLIENQVVGKGNIAAYNALTAKNSDLHLIPSYLELHGQSSAYANAKRGSEFWRAISGQDSAFGTLSSRTSAVFNGFSTLSGLVADRGVSSKYTWGTPVSKSVSKLIASTSSSTASKYEKAITTSQKIASQANLRVGDFMETMDKYVKDNKTYEEWVASASKFGIKDFQAAVEEYGTSENDLRSAFEARESQQASQHKHEREVNEDLFWATGTGFWATVHPKFQEDTLALQSQLVETTDLQLTEMIKGNTQLKQFFDEWVKYYVDHAAYNKATLNAYDVAAIRNAEKSETGDAVLALANALTANIVDLKDPQVQQNVLLSQILLTLQAIMQQNNNTTNVSLPTALSALGLGLTT